MARALRYLVTLFALCVVSLGAAASRMEGLEQLERQLRLNPEQKIQFDIAKAATQRALLSSALTGMEFKERIGRELMRPRPDLDAIFAAQEALVEQNRPLFRAARDEWVRLYALLDEDQVRIAKAYVEKTLVGMEAMAEMMRRFLGQLR
jgi:hypothetical protein